MAVSKTCGSATSGPPVVRHLKSPLEINLIRLLHRCEQRALNESSAVATDWRQSKYIACLREFLNKLQANPVEKPSTEDLTEYKRRITLLETNLETMKESLRNNTNQLNQSAIENDSSNLDHESSFDNAFQTDSDLGKANSNHIDESSSETEKKSEPSKTSQVHENHLFKSVLAAKASTEKNSHVELSAKTSAQPLKDKRSGLFNERPVRVRNNRLRTDTENSASDAKVNSSSSTTVEEILSRHNKQQEKVAEDMLKLARSLKQSTLTANEVIKRDQENLNRANEIAAKNYDKLQTETVRVSNTKPLGCQWWLFVLLGIVVLVFVWVVFLIKIT